MKTITLPRISLGIAILMMAVGAQSVSATTITTYTYTGNDFTVAIAPYTTSDSVQGNFTIATLGDNLPQSNITPLTFSFSDGVTTLDQTNAMIQAFVVATDSSGALSQWYISLYDSGNIHDILAYSGGFYVAQDSGQGAYPGHGQNLGSPGVWETVPEPSTLVLIPTGLLALAVLARKRKIQAKKDVTMKTITLPRISLGIAMLMMAVGAQRVSATTITTYTYTGNDFTSAFAPYTTGDSIQGNFTIATLGDNFAFGPIIPLTFSFSDGVTTYDQTGATVSLFYVGTGASGAINEWEIDLTSLTAYTTNGIDSIALDGNQGDFVQEGYAHSTIADTRVAGRWGVAVPEPRTFVLIPTGLLALAVLARKRKIQGNRLTHNSYADIPHIAPHPSFPAQNVLLNASPDLLQRGVLLVKPSYPF